MLVQTFLFFVCVIWRHVEHWESGCHSIISFRRKHQSVFQNDCDNLYFQQHCMNISLDPFSFQHLVFLGMLIFCKLNEYNMASNYGFNFHFLDDIQCWTCLHLLIYTFVNFSIINFAYSFVNYFTCYLQKLLNFFCPQILFL